ncbi:unnamed protein product [Somion occarium]|uniref:Uncharacterized protein n=1 Tax=Somion occarium TaxID=3059160 RepID=A0ABP1E453_9APHY
MPVATPSTTPGLTNNVSVASSSTCTTPERLLRDSVAARQPGSGNNMSIFSPEYWDPLLYGPVPVVTKVATRTTFTPSESASTFIPTIIRQRALAEGQTVEDGENPWLNHTPWISIFRVGTAAEVIRKEPRRVESIENLVMCTNWDFANVSQLAGLFVDRVVEASAVEQLEDFSLQLTRYAQELYNEFNAKVDPRAAEYFAAMLKYCTLAEFRAWWLTKYPSCVVKLRQNTPSPSHAQLERNLNAALAVATFVGDLYAWQCLTPPIVKLCLDIVAHDDLSVVEELEAILRIISRDCAARMTDSSAAVYQGPVKAQIEHLVQCISGQINTWASTTKEPKPVDVSPLGDDYAVFLPDAEEREAAAKTKARQEERTPISFQPPPSALQLPPTSQMQPPLYTAQPAIHTSTPKTISYHAPPSHIPFDPFALAQQAYLRQLARGNIAPLAQKPHSLFPMTVQQAQFPISGTHNLPL